jgi:transposase-like protein
MTRMKNKNIISNRIKIETSQLKKICFFFSKDFTASQTSEELKISRQTINSYYKIFRELIFDSYIYLKKDEIDLNITYMRIYEKNIYFLEKKNEIFLLDKENLIFPNINIFIQNKIEQTLVNNKKINSVRVIYNEYTKNFTILGFYSGNTNVQNFVDTRLKKFRGIKKENLHNHIKESFFRFNNPNIQIYEKILKHFKIL